MKARIIRFLKQVCLFFSCFNHVKCLDCQWYGTGAEVYCNPPLGDCLFERKIPDDPESPKTNNEI